MNNTSLRDMINSHFTDIDGDSYITIEASYTLGFDIASTDIKYHGISTAMIDLSENEDLNWMRDKLKKDGFNDRIIDMSERAFIEGYSKRMMMGSDYQSSSSLH